MEQELLERVALAQRDYWLKVANRAGDYLGTQADPNWPLATPDVASFSPWDWASFWNQYVDPSKSI
ncbi:hypothetical protein ABLI39_13965 [Pseudarthrobacter sp. B907]|uniref:hypothetical protein n=1 Tax=Pseudarthrobacter sp. B907 TaxID=3158261 RepID=UPI0032DAFA46